MNPGTQVDKLTEVHISITLEGENIYSSSYMRNPTSKLLPPLEISGGDSGRFIASLEAIRYQINEARNTESSNIDRFILPVSFQDSLPIYLILNNEAVIDGDGKISYPDNLYISQVYDHDGITILFDQTLNAGTVSYSSKLPIVNFNTMNYNSVILNLSDNYFTSVKPQLEQLAMLVEAIRLFSVGDAIAEALDNWGVVNFSAYSDDITSWSKESERYVEDFSRGIEPPNNNIAVLSPSAAFRLFIILASMHAYNAGSRKLLNIKVSDYNEFKDAEESEITNKNHLIESDTTNTTDLV